jgi:hypothetical protein
MGVIDSPNCPKCGDVETREHLLYLCERTKRTWDRLMNLLTNSPQSNFMDILITPKHRAHLKIKLELIGLLTQIDRLRLGPEEVIKAILKKLIACDKQHKAEKGIFITLLSKLERPG